jgi:hypothetical protein
MCWTSGSAPPGSASRLVAWLGEEANAASVAGHAADLAVTVAEALRDENVQRVLTAKLARGCQRCRSGAAGRAGASAQTAASKTSRAPWRWPDPAAQSRTCGIRDTRDQWADNYGFVPHRRSKPCSQTAPSRAAVRPRICVGTRGVQVYHQRRDNPAGTAAWQEASQEADEQAAVQSLAGDRCGHRTGADRRGYRACSARCNQRAAQPDAGTDRDGQSSGAPADRDGHRTAARSDDHRHGAGAGLDRHRPVLAPRPTLSRSVVAAGDGEVTSMETVTAGANGVPC